MVLLMLNGKLNFKSFDLPQNLDNIKDEKALINKLLKVAASQKPISYGSSSPDAEKYL